MKNKIEAVFKSTWLWWTLLAIYLILVFTVLSPALVWSLSHEDAYGYLTILDRTGGSYLDALWEPFVDAFEFDGPQLRTQPVFMAMWNLSMLFFLDVSTYLSIEPWVLQALSKIGLLTLAFVSVAIVLKTWTFRDQHGDVRRFSSSTVAFFLISFPGLVAIGTKVQAWGWSNAWISQPVWSLTLFPFLIFFAALVLTLNYKLERNFRLWSVPSVLLMFGAAVVIVLSYEVLALAVPLTVLLLVLIPTPRVANLWLKWRAKALLVFSIGIPYTLMFLGIRWRLSEAECLRNNTCYPGTVFEWEPVAIVFNFYKSMPWGTRDFVAGQAADLGRGFPSPNSTSIALGVGLAISIVALWRAWSIRNGHDIEQNQKDARVDLRGLFTFAIFAIALTASSSTITALSAKSVEYLKSDDVMGYRVTVLVWMSVVLLAIVLVRALMSVKGRVMQNGPILIIAVVMLIFAAVLFPRNVVSLQVHRLDHQIQDTLHREIALGDTSWLADQRRCQFLREWLIPDEPNWEAPQKLWFNGAYMTFVSQHNQLYCSDEALLQYLLPHIRQVVLDQSQ